jgi:hypothetical protein
VVGQFIALFELARLVGQTPKPPEVKYDAARDITTYSTGDVRTAGYSGYGAHFEFAGKTPTVPKSVDIGFGALRISKGSAPEQDLAALHWSDLKTISITWGGQSVEFPAAHDYKVSTNKQVTMFLGRGLEESLSISVSAAQFKALGAADSIRVQLGKDTQWIKGKGLAPLKKLAACIPSD